MTAIFIITSNNKTPQSLNQRHLVFPCTGGGALSSLRGGGAKIRRPCQSTIVGGACAELRHSDRNLRAAWFEKGDFKIGIKKKKHWVYFYHYRMDVYTHFQHTFMFKQKWILHPITPLNAFIGYLLMKKWLMCKPRGTVTEQLMHAQVWTVSGIMSFLHHHGTVGSHSWSFSFCLLLSIFSYF